MAVDSRDEGSAAPASQPSHGRGDGGVRADTGDVNRARLRELGFELGAPAESGVLEGFVSAVAGS
jgi:hypothetical protein